MLIPTCTYHVHCLGTRLTQLMKWTYVETTDCSFQIFFHYFDGALVTALLQETRNDASSTKNFSSLNNIRKLSVKKMWEMFEIQAGL